MAHHATNLHPSHAPVAAEPVPAPRRREPLGMWLIYERPKDYPAAYVARQFFVGEGVVLTTDSIMSAPDLATLQRALARDGLSPLPRSAGQDPKIVETWL